MQQVFRAVNGWLHRDDITRTRHLRLQTYKIVPLSPQAGVLEWCSNTIPLATWLVGGGGACDPPGAHARYRPSDLTHRDARKMMTDAAAQHDIALIGRQYAAVTQQLQPVMRFVLVVRLLRPVHSICLQSLFHGAVFGAVDVV
jgi:ataxia telangiectasia mutated family protein